MYFLVNRFPHFLCQVINWMINEPSAAFSIWRMIVTKHCISDPALIGNISNMFYSSEHCLCLTAVTAVIGARSELRWWEGRRCQASQTMNHDCYCHYYYHVVSSMWWCWHKSLLTIRGAAAGKMLAAGGMMTGSGVRRSQTRGEKLSQPGIIQPAHEQHSFTEDGQWTVPLYLSAPPATKWQILLIWHLLTFITDHLRPFEQIVLQSPKANCEIHFNKLR